MCQSHRPQQYAPVQQPHTNYNHSATAYAQPTPVDPSLASILSRPPAGTKPMPAPSYQPQYQAQYQPQMAHGYSNESLSYGNYGTLQSQNSYEAPAARDR